MARARAKAGKRLVKRSIQADRQGQAVFISYRRSENTLHASLLETSLSALLGDGAVFRDRTTLSPGDPFPSHIEKAIQTAAVVLIVIGVGWLDVRDEKTGERRLEQANDYVRREIELALEWQRKIVPVLIDGAKVPLASDLPKSIAALTDAEAVDLSWHEGVHAIARTVSAETQRLADEIHVPLGAKASATANAAVRSMEASLFNQGLGSVKLDAAELSATLDRLSDFKRVGNSFLMPDLVYAIDLIGVKASRGVGRYVARSKRIESLDQLIEALRQKHTVLAGLMIMSNWWGDPGKTRGVLDFDPTASVVGGLACIVTGWDARRREFSIHTLNPGFGNQGVITLTYNAATKALEQTEMRVIEAAAMPLPFSSKAQRDLQARLPRNPLKRKSGRQPKRRRSKATGG